MQRINHNQPLTWESPLLSTLHWLLPGFSLSLPTFALQMEITRQLYSFKTCQIAHLLGIAPSALTLTASLYQPSAGEGGQSVCP